MLNNNRYLSTALGIAEPVHLVSLEDISPDGVVRVEKEIEIYGLMRNMDELDKASGWELQEQWGLYVPKTDLNAASGGPRVRMTQKSDGEVEYVLTTKTKRSDGSNECEEVSSQGMFDLFKLLADQGLRKKRFFFPIEGTSMKFEVDVFSGPTGAPEPHVKIDLELTDDLSEDFDIGSIRLPFEMSDIRIISPGRKNEEDLAYVRELFDKKYTMRNPCIDAGKASMEGICEAGVTQLLEHELSRSDKSASFKDIFPPFKMPEPNIKEDDCGDHEFRGDYHSPNPLTPEQAENAERVAVAKGESTAYLSEGELSEELSSNKDAFVELADQCLNLKGVLTYNESKREATLKQQLCEVATTIQAIYTQPAE
jgi:hypothetical protein